MGLHFDSRCSLELELVVELPQALAVEHVSPDVGEDEVGEQVGERAERGQMQTLQTVEQLQDEIADLQLITLP